jgi:hypothetical protein
MGITAVKAYAAASPNTLVKTLTKAFGRAWLHQLNDVGSGTISIHPTDAELVATPSVLHYGNIFRFELDGTERFAFILENRSIPPAPQDEETGRIWTLSGRGVLALLDDAIVYPEGTVVGSTARQRRFDWTAIVYDDSSWVAATQIQKQSAASGAPEPQWVTLPGNWPDGDAYWIWSREGVAGYPHMPIGTSYFRKTFTLDTAMDVAVFATCDNRFTFWLDGTQILEGDDWRTTYRFDLPLTAGTHQIAVTGTNDPLSNPQPTSTDPAGLLVAIIEVDENGNLTGTPLVRSDSSFLTLDYPSVVPGMSVGEIWRILIDEAQARGGLAGVTKGFLDATDARSVAWTAGEAIGGVFTVNVALDIGTSYLDVMRTFVEQWIDVEMTPDLELRLYNKNTLGTDRTGTVTLEVGTDFEELGPLNGQFHLTNSILARDTTGLLTEREDAGSLGTYKRRETYLELALAPTESRAQAMSSEVLIEFAQPTIQGNARVIASSGPYASWQPGDTITIPDPTNTAVATSILAISVEEDETGRAVFTIEVAQDDATP